jgi:transcriptional regulator with XRE-family HTH domain
MAKKIAPLLPSTEELLCQLGDRLQVARLRRRLSAKQVAERAGMTPITLRSLERGGSGVTMGAYLSVMQVLGIEQDLNLLGKSDPLGRELQDSSLTKRTKTKKLELLSTIKTPDVNPSVHLRESIGRKNTPTNEIKKIPERAEDEQDWLKKSGFASSETLTDLIDRGASLKKTRD